MQELIEKIEKLYLIKQNKNSYELFRQLELEALEKENKQIMDSWKEGTKYIMDINEGKNILPMSAIDYLIYFKTEKSDYYTIFTDNKYL